MSLESIVGLATIFFGILVKIIGIPDQIRQNFVRKSTEGVSLANQATGFLAYFFWTFYGFLRHDPVLIYGQFLGVVTTSIVLYQFAIYARRTKHARQEKHATTS
jgi:uncharacterized protein with PQ loop repeat